MRFPVVYCDPPWEYNSRAANADTRFGGGATGHCNVTDGHNMAAWAHQFEAMKQAPGVMLMWVTGPHYETGAALMRAWGYTPVKPIFYWVKTYPGGPGIFYSPGAYTGSNVEYILLGQANPNRPLTPDNCGGEKGVPEVIYSPHPRCERGKIIHSRKPGIFRDHIVRLFGDLPRVEVFARERVVGWHAIGDQLEGGVAIQPDRVIDPLPPPSIVEAGTRRKGDTIQPPLFQEWSA